MGIFSRPRPRSRMLVASGELAPYAAGRSAADGGRRNGAVTAAGMKVNPKNADEVRRLSLLPWQMDAFRYYNSCGECWYAAQFYARALSKVRLYAAIRDEQGELEELDADSVPAKAWARVRDPGGGRTIIQSAYGRLMFLIGEAFLTATEEEDDDGEVEETWEVLAPTELTIAGSSYVRYRGSGWNPRTYGMGDSLDPEPGKLTAWRLWQRHPEESIWADSPIRAVLGLFEELMLLQLAVRAQATSRAANGGLLYVPDQLTIPSPDGVNDEDPLADPVFVQLTKGLTTPIKNPGDASAVVPILLRGPAEYADAIKHIKLSDPTERYPEEGLRTECIRRISLGLDMPPEVLLGMADSNHWTAWQIDEQTWNAHLDPVALRMADDFAATYLRPACRAEGFEDWRNVVLGVDPADAINHPNRITDAKALHDRGVISDETLRDAGGFNDEDAPSDEERAFYEAVKLRQPVPGTPFVSGEQEDEGANSPGEVEPGPPELALAEEGAEQIPSELAAAVTGAAMYAVERGREIAGARLRSRTADCRDCQQAIEGIPNRLVAHTLGAERVAEHGTPLALVAGASDVFRDLCVQWGYSHPQAAKLAEIAEKHAARSLLRREAQQLPAGFYAHVRRS